MEEIQIQFPHRQLSLENVGERVAFNMPEFDACAVVSEVETVASEFVSLANLSLSLTSADYESINIYSIAEKTADGVVNRKILQTITGKGRHRIQPPSSGASSENAAATAPKAEATLAERTASLIRRNDAVREAALALTSTPMSWGNINLAFETIKGLTSPRGKREDWEQLKDWGWATEDQLNRLYDTAGYYRHGHPRGSLKYQELSLAEGEAIARSLFERLVEHLEKSKGSP